MRSPSQIVCRCIGTEISHIPAFVFDSTGVDALLIGQPLVIGLVNLNIPDPIDLGADREVDFDDITLDASPTVIPIPSSALLLCTGVGLLVLRMRRGGAQPRR